MGGTGWQAGQDPEGPEDPEQHCGDCARHLCERGARRQQPPPARQRMTRVASEPQGSELAPGLVPQRYDSERFATPDVWPVVWHVDFRG